MSKLPQQQPASERTKHIDAAERSPGVTFRDKLYKSRVIVFPGDVTAHVENGAVTVSDPAQIDALSKRDDFVRVSG